MLEASRLISPTSCICSFARGREDPSTAHDVPASRSPVIPRHDPPADLPVPKQPADHRTCSHSRACKAAPRTILHYYLDRTITPTFSTPDAQTILQPASHAHSRNAHRARPAEFTRRWGVSFASPDAMRHGMGGEGELVRASAGYTAR